MSAVVTFTLDTAENSLAPLMTVTSGPAAEPAGFPPRDPLAMIRSGTASPLTSATASRGAANGSTGLTNSGETMNGVAATPPTAADTPALTAPNRPCTNTEKVVGLVCTAKAAMLACGRFSMLV